MGVYYMRDICPRCDSRTALGTIKCFKCGYQQQRFTSFARNCKDYGLGDTELPMPEEIIYNPNQFHYDALIWLAKAHIFNNMIMDQGIGYCPGIHKVFIPAYSSTGVLQFYQLRALDPNILNKCKYLTYGKSSEYMIIYEDQINSNQIILVEDHLSAMRIRKFGNVCALSGTFLSTNNCTSLVRTYSNFIFWLDPDQPGRQAMFKNLKRLRYYADKFAVKCLFTSSLEPDYRFYYVNYGKITEDPKYFHDSDIAKILTSEVILCAN